MVYFSENLYFVCNIPFCFSIKRGKNVSTYVTFLCWQSMIKLISPLPA